MSLTRSLMLLLVWAAAILVVLVDCKMILPHDGLMAVPLGLATRSGELPRVKREKDPASHVINSALAIPIGILQSLQESLHKLAKSASTHVSPQGAV